MDHLQNYRREEQERQKGLVYKKIKRFLNNPLFNELIHRQNKKLFSYVNKEGFLLEIGCGYGNFLVDALKETQPKQVVGMDISWENLKVGRDVLLDNFPNLLVGMVENIPFRQSSFDTIIMRGVLHHLSDPYKCLLNLSDLLKPGGQLIIMEGDPEAMYRKIILGMADYFGMKHEASQFPHLPSEKITGIFEDNGNFNLVIREQVSGLWYPVAFMGVFLGNAGVYLEWINNSFQRIFPGIFGWWYILVFRKKMQG